MNWYCWFFLTGCLVLCTIVKPVYAATEVVAGRVVSRDGLVLMIEQRDGRTKRVKLNEKTPVVAVPRVSAPLVNRIMNDSKVSIIVKDGKPVVVQMVEVPK
jgi:hypothetical protein